MILQLTKQSTDLEIKAYFEEVLKLSKDSEEFPVNLDDVWPLVYSRRDKAISSLKSNDLFLQDVDYQVFPKKVENSVTSLKLGENIGRPKNIYMLSVPCLEFFIARKVRPVFEVYRQVFHKVANGELPMRMPNCLPGNTVGTLAPLAYYHTQIIKRYAQVVRDSRDNGTIQKLMDDCEYAYETYRIRVANLSYVEAVGILEGKEALQDELIYP